MHVGDTPDHLDLFSLDTFEHGPPHDRLAVQLAREPIFWQEEGAIGGAPPGPGYWAVLGHADVAYVDRHPEVFSSAAGGTQIRDPLPWERSVTGRQLVDMDGPEHRVFRRSVAGYFSSEAAGRMEQLLTERARSLIVSSLDREHDLADDVAVQLPICALEMMLGSEPQESVELIRSSGKILGVDDPEHCSRPSDFASGLTAIMAFARTVSDRKRAEPGDDLISHLVSMERDGSRLSQADISMMVLLAVVAGLDTTRNAIAGGVHAFATHPREWDRLRSDPDALLEPAVEEILRWVSPVMNFRRTAVADTEVRGVTIHAGEKVVIYYTSANRDPAVFAEPQRFEIDRYPNPHLALGSGPHRCLGATLARTQLRIFFGELAQRVRSIEVVGAPVHLRSRFLNGIKHLPVVFRSS